MRYLGRIALITLDFMRRRFYRIVPPLVLMVLICTPLALLVRNDFIAGIGRQITSVIGFCN